MEETLAISLGMDGEAPRFAVTNLTMCNFAAGACGMALALPPDHAEDVDSMRIPDWHHEGRLETDDATGWSTA